MPYGLVHILDLALSPARVLSPQDLMLKLSALLGGLGALGWDDREGLFSFKFYYLILCSRVFLFVTPRNPKPRALDRHARRSGKKKELPGCSRRVCESLCLGALHTAQEAVGTCRTGSG